jgi:hypothetical protein
MVFTTPARPVKFFRFRMRSWMWGFLFGALWSLSYMGAAGVFGSVPPQPQSVDIATSQLAIMPANTAYLFAFYPLLRILIIPPTKGIFLTLSVMTILFLWSFVFHLVFPITKKKLIAVFSIIAGYAILVQVFRISPYICVPCLQSTATEWDPRWFIRQHSQW